MPNLTAKRGTIARKEFLAKFVQASGVSYSEAARVYDAMVGLFADAIVTGQKIGIGKVLSIKPVRRKARRVNMGFRGTKTTIHLSDRISFKVSVYRKFMAQHELKWQL